MSRVLFICKSGLPTYGYGSGLTISASLVADMLSANGIPSWVSNVIDNNDIDREVTKWNPTHVIIEALWVVPEKFAELSRLHPGVKWVVRIHSDTPFLAEDAVATNWILRYAHHGVRVAFNSERTASDFLDEFQSGDYLPNYYPIKHRHVNPANQIRKVGCFGAIRPMKNHLLQAMAALGYARWSGVPIEFHVNATRVDGQNGQAILRNLQFLFAGSQDGTLVEHDWLSHDKFLDVMSQMDVNLSVSMTETFCVVAADAIASGVPVICSDHIPWAHKSSIVEETDTKAIRDLMWVLTGASRHWIYEKSRESLARYSEQSKNRWLEYLEG